MATKKLGKKTHKEGEYEGLTDQQVFFIKEALATKDLNYTEAARKAGYKQPRNAAHKLLKNTKIRDAIFAAQQKRSKKTGIQASRVLEELAAIAFSNPADMFDEYGVLRPIQDMDEATQRTLAEFTVDITERNGAVNTRTRVKQYSKLEALKLLMAHLGMLDSNGRAPINGGNGYNLQKLLEHVENKSNIVDAEAILGEANGEQDI